MGQTVTVVEKPTADDRARRYELNRSLTGMAHVRFKSIEGVTGHRPVDELARRLFQTGQVRTVHMYSNQVTVFMKFTGTGEGLLEVIQGLYAHYTEGVEPKKFD